VVRIVGRSRKKKHVPPAVREHGYDAAPAGLRLEESGYDQNRRVVTRPGLCRLEEQARAGDGDRLHTRTVLNARSWLHRLSREGKQDLREFVRVVPGVLGINHHIGFGDRNSQLFDSLSILTIEIRHLARVDQHEIEDP
jgi:hypothetical protein